MPSIAFICPYCGDSSAPDPVFCVSCGATLAQATTRTTRLLSQPQTWRFQLPALPVAQTRRNWRQLLMAGSVTAFGLALLTLLLLVAYIGSHRPGLDAVAWLCVLAGAIHLVRGTRRGEPLRGMRWAVLCAALPFAQITQAFITTTVLFGCVFGLLTVLQFLVALIPKHRWRP